MTKAVTAKSAIAGSDCRVRSSARRSLARIAAKAEREEVTRADRSAPIAEPQDLVGVGQVALGVVGDEDAGAAGAGADQRPGELAALGVEVGVGLVEQQQLAARAGRSGRSPAAGASRRRARRPARRRGAPSPTASSSSSIRARRPRARDPVQPGVEGEVLAAAEVAVEERLVAEVADPAAQLPGLAAAARSRAPAPRRRSGAAASRGPAAASSCRRRWGRGRPATRRRRARP